jgi:hypothetical protein
LHNFENKGNNLMPFTTERLDVDELHENHATTTGNHLSICLETNGKQPIAQTPGIGR